MRKVLFVSEWDAQSDRKGWSGIPFHIYERLCKYYDVSLIQTKSSVPVWIKINGYIVDSFLGGQI